MVACRRGRFFQSRFQNHEGAFSTVKSKILIQLDSDNQPSVFDGVVAVDAGVDQLFRHSGVRPTDVRNLVYGAIFTRGVKDLCQTAIFVGGSDVSAGDELMKEVLSTFFGPMRVSVMVDSNGANTTAAAAVLSAAQHVPLEGSKSVVLGGTGPVGQRAARLLARAGSHVRVGSRSKDRAAAICQSISDQVPGATLDSWSTAGTDDTAGAVEGTDIVICAGTTGVELLPDTLRRAVPQLKVAIDLNAVPPLGIGGIEVTDKGCERDGVIGYGAIGVGGTKMKIHKSVVAKLFEAADQVFDAEQIYEVGQSLVEK